MLLTNFRILMQKVAVLVQNPVSNDGSSSTFRLLCLISNNEWSKSFSNVQGNFLIAAMHISFMKEFLFQVVLESSVQFGLCPFSGKTETGTSLSKFKS